MTPRPVEEMRCPTCGARPESSGRTPAAAVKSDLRLLRAALEATRGTAATASWHLDAGDLEAALQHARSCHELRPGPESHRLLAVCQLLRGDWPEALLAAMRG